MDAKITEKDEKTPVQKKQMFETIIQHYLKVIQVLRIIIK